METEKTESTEIRVTGVSAEATTGGVDFAGDMAFIAWVMALEAVEARNNAGLAYIKENV